LIARLAAAALSTFVFACAWIAWPHLHVELLVNRAEAETGDQLDNSLQELLQMGPVGVDRLVMLLGAERTEIRDAAFRVAVEKIDRHRRLGDIAATSPLDRMAASLARQVAHFDREPLRLASRLAERLLSATDRNSHAQRLRDCQVVIAADIRRRSGERVPPPVPATARARWIDDLPLPLADAPAPDILAAISPPQSLEPDLVTEAKPIQPPNDDAEPGPRTDETPEDVATSEIPVADIDFEVPSKPQPLDVKPSSSDSTIDSNFDPRVDRSQPNRAAALRPADLSGLLDLDARLNSDNGKIATDARDEMERDKISDAQLALARGAVDPDPKVRKELVEALGFVNTVDTRAWLVFLSHDEDATVRQAVVGRIATGEHAAFKRLAELADGDSDERVRSQARVAIENKKNR
jgi:hypothetical protein